ncbi:MAG: hypothetical protein AAGC56_09930 [Pseudomonadota bacterium]
MTGNLLLDNVISLAGIGLVVAVIAALFRGTRAQATREAALVRLAFDEPDFVVAEAVGARNAQVFRSETGETAIVLVVGDGLVVRRFAPGALRIDETGDEIVLRADDLPGGRLAVRQADAQAVRQWARAVNDWRDSDT